MPSRLISGHTSVKGIVSSKVAIITAVIGLIGVLGTAVISNVDKLRSIFSHDQSTSNTTTPPSTRKVPTRRMGPIEDGIRLQGFNLSPNPLRAATAEECSEKCEQNESCMAMTFVNNGDCWLKSEVPLSRSLNPNMASAIKRSR